MVDDGYDLNIFRTSYSYLNYITSYYNNWKIKLGTRKENLRINNVITLRTVIILNQTLFSF